MSETQKLSKVEILKENSRQLRGTLAEELAPSVDAFRASQRKDGAGPTAHARSEQGLDGLLRAGFGVGACQGHPGGQGQAHRAARCRVPRVRGSGVPRRARTAR